jgi:hypothetical protein
MSNKVTGIADNAYEDFLDEYSSGYIFNYVSDYFKPIKAKYDSGSALDEAIQSSLSTIEFGVRNYAMILVNQYLYEKLKTLSYSYLAYIFAGKAKVLSKIKSKGIVGRNVSRVFKIFGNIIGSTDERIQMTKIANNLSKEVNTTVMNQKQLVSSNKNHMDKLSLSAESKHIDKNLQLYMHKTRTGTWSRDDRKIYVSMHGSLKKGLTWNKLYPELNKFVQFTLTAEGEVANLPKVLLDNLTAQNVGKVKD